MEREKGDDMKVSVGISARHVHLTEEHFQLLFGEDATLEEWKPIRQPQQFASQYTVTIKTDRDYIENVRVMGPARLYTQVEISQTDAYKLGIKPPIRDSGDLKQSAPITLIGPLGTIVLEEGCIIPNRHIHLTPKQKALYGLDGLQKVHIQVLGEKGGIMSNVYLKEQEDAYFELHLDTDDANAFGLHNGDVVTILEGEMNGL